MAPFDYESSFVEIRFPIDPATGETVDNFLKVAETLTRIGAPAYSKIPGDTSKVLWQSCLLLHKRQKYYLCHFKELFLLDGKESKTTLTDEDLARRNAIALLLEEWGLIDVVDPDRTQIPTPAPTSTIKIISFRDKGNWQLKSKYEIGKPGRHK